MPPRRRAVRVMMMAVMDMRLHVEKLMAGKLSRQQISEEGVSAFFDISYRNFML